MRNRIATIGMLLLLCAAAKATAQNGKDLLQQARTQELIGECKEANKLYEVIVRDSAKDRSLVAQAKLGLGACWLRLGQDTGKKFLKDVIDNYKEQTNEVREAMRLIDLMTAKAPATSWTARDHLLVVEFQNKTDNPVFDSGLGPALVFQLEQSPYLQVLPYNLVREALTSVDRLPSEPVTLTAAQEICGKLGARGILLPSISGQVRNYSVTLEVVKCSPGRETLAFPQRLSPVFQDQILHHLGRAALKLRAALGESPKSIEIFGKRRPITTKSHEALEAYGDAYKQQIAGLQQGDAVRNLGKALRLDPNFASARALWAAAYDDPDAAAAAYDLRDRVSEGEKLYIEAIYQSLVLGDLDEAISILERLRDLFPRDGDVRYLLGNQYRSKGRFDDGLEQLQEAVQINSENAVARASLFSNYMELNRSTEAKLVYKQALAQGVDNAAEIHMAMYSMAFMESDRKVMDQELEWLRSRLSITRDRALAASVQSMVSFGDLVNARRLFENLRNRPEVDRGVVVSQAMNQAMAEALFGNFGRARALVEEFRLGASRAGVVTYGLAGDDENTKRLVGEINSRSSEDTFLNVIWIPTALAALEIHKGRGVDAIKLLESAKAYEPSASSLWAIYVRGLAYLQTKSGQEAAAEFQKILDHRGVDPLSPLYSLSHFRLAEAYTLMGNVPKARGSYDDFFAIWNHATPGVPILLEAKTKYGELPPN